jgi:membrane protein|tara:strand:+ start:1198 stop:2124 length:927 start_codon:yes stop_codon:yes gene_type:complete
LIEKYLNKITSSSFVTSVLDFSKKKSLFGFDKVPVYYVASYFKEAVWKGTLGTRSASLAFNFFLAIFPGILFLFSLIPFIPIHGFLDALLLNLEGVLPQSIKEPVLQTIHDLIDNEREGFLIFNIVLTLYFASNGLDNLMTQFNATFLFQEKRAWWKKRLIAIVLVLILTVLTVSAVVLISFTKEIMGLLIEMELINETVNWFFVNVGRWIIVVLLFYIAISSLYYFGPAKRKKWKFFSAGSSTATILILISSLGFSYYITHFSQYNAIYGSVGTVIIVMLYFQLNSFILLLGFELNASIRMGRKEIS